MARILIVYHSQSGNTDLLARAVARGVAATPGSTADLKRALDATTVDLAASDGIVICSPEYFGYMSGAVKDLFDRTYEELKDNPAMYRKPYCAVISAGNDGTGALRHIERICLGYRMKKAQEPIISKGIAGPEVLSRCEELGMIMAEGCDARIFR